MPYYASGSHGRGIDKSSQEMTEVNGTFLLTDDKKDADYGKLIPPDRAEEILRNHIYIGGTARWIFHAYNQHIDRETRVGVRHYNYGYIDQTLIFAKSKSDRRIEVAVCGVSYPQEHESFSSLTIGLKYNGSNVNWKPRDPKFPPRPIGMDDSRYRESMIYRDIGLKIRGDALVKMKEGYDFGKIESWVADGRLEELTRELCQSIKSLLRADNNAGLINLSDNMQK